MKKLLFAINYRQLENQIAPLISDEYEVVGSVEFRETIAYKIAKTGADTVLIRETMQGSRSWDRLLEQIRRVNPDIRILMLCEQRLPDALFLKMLEQYGVRESICVDCISPEILADYILHPIVNKEQLPQHRLLYAINFQRMEDLVSRRISGVYQPVGAVAHRDGLISLLGKTRADTVLLRESLPGSLPVEETLEQIRETYPDVRIVLICGQYKEDAPFLKKLEELGIHDVINADYVSHEELADLILHPVISDPE